jgi:YHS domain-containing protein
MKTNRGHIKVTVLLCLLVVGLFVLAGCKKKTEPAGSMQAEGITSAAEIEQKICPVMEGPINKEVYTTYKGKKVYFCCAGCKEAFEKEPEKYLSKLPQFNESD